MHDAFGSCPRRALLACALLATACTDEIEAPAYEIATIDLGAGPVEVPFVDIDGRAVLEDDIVLGPAELVRSGAWRLPVQTDGPSPYSAIAPSLPWPSGRITYEIDQVAFPNDDGVLPQTPGELANTRIRTAIAQWNDSTLVRLVERSAANANLHYVRFVRGDSGMSAGEGRSEIGMQPGTHQYIWLGNGTSIDVAVSTVVHEIGHTVGLFHEQSRTDRDEHVQIVWEHIATNKEANFWAYGPLGISGLDVGTYDLESRMHYGSSTFARRGLYTILRLRTPAGTPCDPYAAVPPVECRITPSATLTDRDIAGVTRQVTGDQSSAALRFKSDATDRCLRPSSGSTTAGASVILSSCDVTTSRRWYPFTLPGSTRTLLVNLNSRMCLTIDGTTFTQQNCTNALTQQFSLANAGSGKLFLQTSSGSCVFRTASNTLGIDSACPNMASHRWSFQ